MSNAVRQPMTVEDFLIWEERQELRYEFDGWDVKPVVAGDILAMPEIDVTLPREDIYTDVTLPEAEAG